MQYPRRRTTRSALVLMLAAASALTWFAPVAAGAPPATGAARPMRVPPASISADYVGPAVVGPRGYCGPNGPEATADPQAILCVDVIIRSCREWKRRNGVWLPAGTRSNNESTVLFVAPYSQGYHWTWTLGGGFRVMATSCLTRFEPSYG